MAIKSGLEGDLAEAVPALAASIRALDTLTNDISEVRRAPLYQLVRVCIIRTRNPQGYPPLLLLNSCQTMYSVCDVACNVSAQS
jgi:hypothetical protein